MGCSKVDGATCLFSFKHEGKISRVLYQVVTGRSRSLTLPAQGNYVGFQDSHSLFYTVPSSGNGSGASLHSLDFETGADKEVDRLASTETLITLNVDGVNKQFVQRTSGSAPRFVRPLGQHPTESSASFDWADGFQVTDFGILRTEWWPMKSPVISGRRSASLLAFTTNSDATEGPFKPRLSLVVSAAVNAAQIPSFFSTVVDANNDIMSVLIGQKGKSIAYVCDANGKTKVMAPALLLKSGDIAKLEAWPSSNGFLVTIHDLTHSNTYKFIRLSEVPGGFTKRTCADTQVSIVDLDVPMQTTSDQIDVTLKQFQSADGTQVPVWIAAPKGIAPKRLILDVYGAFGELKAMPFTSPDMAKLLTQTQTVMAFAIVRGDGDNGFDYALASQAPNREKAVEDVVGVAKGLMTDYPSLVQKPTLRGGSAGGWLAARATLVHPEVFAGAIGVAGAYLLNGQTSGNFAFFDQSDTLLNTLQNVAPGCGGTSFRLVQAKDDGRVPFGDTQIFADALKAKNCKVDFVIFENGGHQIGGLDPADPDYQRKMDALLTAF